MEPQTPTVLHEEKKDEDDYEDHGLQPGGDAVPVPAERGWIETIRSDTIDWILRKRAEFGYQYRTAYLSLVHYDRVLARNQIPEAEVMSLVIACLSLAAKIEESEPRPLADYSVNYDETSIKNMESIVLDTFDWRFCCVTPFSFLKIFAPEFGVESDQEFINRASHLIVSIMKATHTAEHRPFIIAAAAVLAAHDKHLSEEALGRKMDAVTWWGADAKEMTIECYRLLLENPDSENPSSDDDVEVEIPESSENPSNDDDVEMEIPESTVSVESTTVSLESTTVSLESGVTQNLMNDDNVAAAVDEPEEESSLKIEIKISLRERPQRNVLGLIKSFQVSFS